MVNNKPLKRLLYSYFSVFIVAGIAETGVSQSFSEIEQNHALETDSPYDRLLHSTIRTLRTLPTGSILLDEAKKLWKLNSDRELSQVVDWASSSHTDAILTRTIEESTGLEIQNRKIIIHLRKTLKAGDLLIDLAHELTHATRRPTWDPYDPNLTLGKYIQHTIEGKGGEVDAVLVECQVSKEWEKISGYHSQRCRSFLDESGDESLGLSRGRVLQEFYKVGEYKEIFVKSLESESNFFPHLSNQNPSLISSTGQAPYPISLIREYREMNLKACVNAVQRRAHQRTPANLQRSSAELISKRCHS